MVKVLDKEMDSRLEQQNQKLAENQRSQTMVEARQAATKVVASPRSRTSPVPQSPSRRTVTSPDLADPAPRGTQLAWETAGDQDNDADKHAERRKNKPPTSNS